MNSRDIEWRREKLEEKRRELESGQLNALRELLPNRIIAQICKDCQYYFRVRLLTPLVTIFHMISSAMSRDGSFQSAWHLNGESGKSGALAKARKRLPLCIWQRLHEWVTNQIDKETTDEDRWRGHRMIGVDGTCVSMSDEPKLVEHFGRWNSKCGYSRFPIARVLVIFNLRTLVTTGYKASPCKVGETSLLKSLLSGLQRGDILVGDRHFSGVNLYGEYQRAGIEFITRAHSCLKIERLKVVEILDEGDLVVEMQMDPHYLRKDSSLPKSIRVRITKTEAKIRGKKETFWLVTSLLDPCQYPAQEIKEWYKKRWKVETLIEELKIWLGADILRSKSVEGVYKELYARVIALNLVHWLILKAARKHRQNRERISVSATLRLATTYSLKMSTAPGWQPPHLYDQLLEHVAYSKVPDRTNRIEPRMIKRQKKHYPMLKISRAEWRRIYALAA